MNTAEAIRTHKKLLRASVEGVEACFLQVRSDGADEPVVLVLDLLDMNGRAIAESCVGGAEIAAHLAAGPHRPSTRHMMICGLSRTEACEFLASRFPDANDVLEAADPGAGYPVVVVSGRATAFVIPPGVCRRMTRTRQHGGGPA
jgi:hypothetical protein